MSSTTKSSTAVSSTAISFTPLIRISFRFMSLWLVWLGLQVSVLTWLSHHQLNQAVIVSLFSVLVYWLSAGLIWGFSSRLARLIAGNDAGMSTLSLPAPGETDWIKLALILCGLLLITQDGLRDAGNYLTLVVMLVNSGQASRLAEPGISLGGVLAIIKVLLGLCSIGYSRPLARFIQRKTA